MGGKSTFLRYENYLCLPQSFTRTYLSFGRQCAIISILAQMGSFVPAASAELGLVDSVYSRV